MLRTQRSRVALISRAAMAALPSLWPVYGVGGVLSAATLIWMVWPSSPRPEVPAQLPTAAEVKRVAMPVGAVPATPAVMPPKSSPQPESKPTTAQPATKPQKSEEEVFRETFFDPRFDSLDARYSHEVKLTAAQVKELTEGIDAVERGGNDFERVHQTYMTLDQWVTRPDVEQAFYARIKSGLGFKFPDLPELWTKYADKSGLELNLPEYVTQGYYQLRIKNLKAAIVRGRATEGDVKFVKHAIGYVSDLRTRMNLRLQNARRLEGYLKAEGLIGQNPEAMAGQRAQADRARERWRQSLESMANDMLNQGDPGREAQDQKEREQADARQLMQDLRRRY